MSNIKPFKKIYSGNYELLKVQDSINESLQAISRIPIVESNLLTNVSIGTSATGVEHGLGRRPLGFMIVDRTANVAIWRSPVESQAPTSLIMLLADTATNVSILIF